jgi:hypothetical protein
MLSKDDEEVKIQVLSGTKGSWRDTDAALGQIPARG